MFLRRRFAAVVMPLGLAALTALLLGAAAPPVQAQTADPTDAPTTTTAPATTLDPDAVKVAIDLTRTRDQLDKTDRAIAVAQAKLTSAQTAFDLANSDVVANQVQLAIVKARVRERAVTAYTRGSTGSEALLDVKATTDLHSAEHYVSSALEVDDKDLAGLDDLEQRLEQVRDQRAQDVADLRTTKARLDADRETLAQLQDREQALLDKWGAVPVMGDAWLTPTQLADWYRSTGATPSLAAGTTIDDIARLYEIEGRAEGVRGDLAFAQAIIETGSFKVAAGNNYSGIGVCDSCTGGYGFPTPLDGIRAQIQLLRNYADPDSRAAKLANPPSPSLYGTDPAKAAATYDSFFLKGKAPLWNVMGNGNWATDPTYARKVIELFARMVVYAAAHPG
jgi:flagellum-specific peptidoglycan hydrolase FlgJ